MKNNWILTNPELQELTCIESVFKVKVWYEKFDDEEFSWRLSLYDTKENRELVDDEPSEFFFEVFEKAEALIEHTKSVGRAKQIQAKNSSEDSNFWFTEEVFKQIELSYLQNKNLAIWENATEIPMRNFVRFMLLQDQLYFFPEHTQFAQYDLWLKNGRFTIKFIAELIHLRHWDLDFEGDLDKGADKTIDVYKESRAEFERVHIEWLKSKGFDFNANLKWGDF